MNVNSYPIVRSLASYVFPKKLFSRPGSGGSFSSEYCYSVWLRHLHYLLNENLFNSLDEIKNVAEIGPGDSLGIGLSSLYTGALNYYAFDVIEHANLQRNQMVNADLFRFFTENKEIPNTHQQRNTSPKLPRYEFPAEKVTYDISYYQERMEAIRKGLEGDQSSGVKIKYVVPWFNTSSFDLPEMDLIFSQAVMEHVADIEFAYKEMYRWLRKGGVISHQIDFKTHEMTKEWNGHWFIGPKMWKFLSHGRKYPMNRLPLSAHLNMIEKVGFTIKNVIPVTQPNTFKQESPEVPGVLFTEGDLTTSGALVQAVKE
jgi:hypothetical protein